MRARPHHAGRYWGFSGLVLGPAFPGRDRRAPLSDFRFFASGSRCQIQLAGLWGCFAAKRDSQLRVKSGAPPAGVLGVLNGH